MITNIKILLVEDDINALNTLKMMLQEIGITNVFETKNGDEASQFIDFDAVKIDLIISDWNMPKKTGIDLLKDIRNQMPDIPFIMTTGRADVNSVLDAADLGVTGYLRKPFSINELEDKIKAALTKRR
mgnify:CR=1 FL=1